MGDKQMSYRVRKAFGKMAKRVFVIYINDRLFQTVVIQKITYNIY